MQQDIIKALMKLRWWVLLSLAVLFFLGGIGTKFMVDAREALANAPTPRAVPLAQFDKEHHIYAANEVNVIGWVGMDRPEQLVDQDDRTRHLYFVFGGPVEETLGVVRAAIILTPHQVKPFAKRFPSWNPTRTMPGGILEINATASVTHRFDSEVFDLITQRGLEPSPDFVFLRPFLFGRQDGLRAPTWWIVTSDLMFPAAIVLAIMSAIKLVLERARAAQVQTMDRTHPAQPSKKPAPQGLGSQALSALFGFILIAVFYIGAIGFSSAINFNADFAITLLFILVIIVGLWWEARRTGSLETLKDTLRWMGSAEQKRAWPQDREESRQPSAASGSVSVRDLSQLSGSPLIKTNKRPRLFSSRAQQSKE